MRVPKYVHYEIHHIYYAGTRGHIPDITSRPWLFVPSYSLNPCGWLPSLIFFYIVKTDVISESLRVSQFRKFILRLEGFCFTPAPCWRTGMRLMPRTTGCISIFRERGSSNGRIRATDIATPRKYHDASMQIQHMLSHQHLCSRFIGLDLFHSFILFNPASHLMVTL